MRQIGTLPLERDAQRFTAYLITLGIDAVAEENSTEWAIWVRDENLVDQAREAFDAYRRDPQDSRYQGVEREAESIRRETLQQRLTAQKNLIEMRGRWKNPAALTANAPLTATLIALSIIVTLVGGFHKTTKGLGGTINQELSFVTVRDFAASGENPVASLLKGELWRAVTPIFIHLSPIHLLFNMIMFYQFGRVVESFHGTARFALAVLVIAAVSNIAQALSPKALEPLGLDGSPFFGGMSGVVYGLFGYVWIRSVFNPIPGIYLSQSNVIILLGWLFLCMTGVMGPIANVAHVVGLLVGATFAYVPSLWRK